MGNGVYGSSATGSPAVIENMALIIASSTCVSARAHTTAPSWYDLVGVLWRVELPLWWPWRVLAAHRRYIGSWDAKQHPQPLLCPGFH
jgi:hypothetical protein